MRLHEEVTAINDELERIEREIQQLETRKIELKNRLNEVQPVVAALPPETLSIIFQILADSDPTGVFPLRIISAVSSHWRQLATLTPSLWACLTIQPPKPSDEKSVWEPKIRLLRLYYKNVGSLCLSITLSLNRHRLHAKLDPDPLLRVIFRENPGKTKAFCSYSLLPTSWCNRISENIHTELTNLQRLILGFEDDPRVRSQVPFSAPSLTHLSFLNVRRIPARFPCEQLTTLHLYSTPADYALHMLLQLPCLKTFVTVLPTWIEVRSSSFASILQKNGATLPNLTSFTWPYDHSPWFRFILNRVRFPSLHHLHFEGRGDRLNQPTSLRESKQSFFASLHRLKHYHCSMAAVWAIPPPASWPFDEDLYSVISWTALPESLEELTLKVHDDQRDLPHIFYHLTLRIEAETTQRGIPRSQNVLPRLKALVINLTCGDIVALERSTFSYFVEMLRSRRDGPSDKWETRERLESVTFVPAESSKASVVIEDVDNQHAHDVYQRLLQEGLRVKS